ncbi:hypothetical protein BH10BAC2_BH10BAC2_26980 [soil metagenome]
MVKKEERASQARKIRVSNSAYKNINDLVDFIAFTQQQPFNAVKVGETIENTIEKIGINPYVYKECEQLPTSTKIYRQCACLSWLIIYKITPKEILILSVIHGAVNPVKIKKLKKIK